MASVNKVILIGNLGKDPEIRTTPQGTSLARFSVATTTNWKDSTGRQAGEDGVARRRRLGEARADLRRVPPQGQEVYVEGSLQTRSWEDQNGQKRYKTEVKANNVVMLVARDASRSDAAPGPGQGPSGGQRSRRAARPTTTTFRSRHSRRTSSRRPGVSGPALAKRRDVGLEVFQRPLGRCPGSRLPQAIQARAVGGQPPGGFAEALARHRRAGSLDAGGVFRDPAADEEQIAAGDRRRRSRSGSSANAERAPISRSSEKAASAKPEPRTEQGPGLLPGKRRRNPVGPRRVRDHDGARGLVHRGCEGSEVARSSSDGSRGIRGSSLCVSRSARPRPGKCLTHPPTPCAWSPARKSTRRARRSLLDRPRRTGPAAPAPKRPAGARSTTGARSTSKPSRAHASPASSPARRATPRSAASRKQIDGPSRSRKRSTGPPSWSTQRTGRPGRSRSSRVSSRSCSTLSIFRRKRMTAHGGRPLQDLPLRGKKPRPRDPDSEDPRRPAEWLLNHQSPITITDASSAAPAARPAATARRPASGC